MFSGEGEQIEAITHKDMKWVELGFFRSVCLCVQIYLSLSVYVVTCFFFFVFVGQLHGDAPKERHPGNLTIFSDITL